MDRCVDDPDTRGDGRSDRGLPAPVAPAPHVAVIRTDLGGVARRARTGDPAAWRELVERLTPLVERIAWDAGVRSGDIRDVAQTTWLRMYENLARLRDPDAVVTWVATTARHESWRTVRQRNRTIPVAEFDHEQGEPGPDPVEVLLHVERQTILAEVVSRLNPRQRRIVEVLGYHETPYRDAADQLGMPVGSLGPTRQRCLRFLAEQPELRALAG